MTFTFVLNSSKFFYKEKVLTLRIDSAASDGGVEANIFDVLPFASVWGSTVDFDVLFLIYVCYDDLLSCLRSLLPIDFRNTLPSIRRYLSIIFLGGGVDYDVSDFCWLNMLVSLAVNSLSYSSRILLDCWPIQDIASRRLILYSSFTHPSKYPETPLYGPRMIFANQNFFSGRSRWGTPTRSRPRSAIGVGYFTLPEHCTFLRVMW